MSVRITFIDATGPDWLGMVENLAEAVEDVHQHWMEEDGPQAFVLQGGDGFILAVNDTFPGRPRNLPYDLRRRPSGSPSMSVRLRW